MVRISYSTSKKMNMKRLFLIIITVLILSPFFIKCYYDSEEVLYPSFNCDTANVTYQHTIALMMDNYCVSCHSGSNPQGSIRLTTHDDLVINEARITESILHTGVYPMPQNGGMLNSCSIRQWEIWVDTGMPE
jgi:hypothetical protein